MTANHDPRPSSDPAAEGIPEYADQDSTAWDDGPQRVADGPDPAALPSDEPVAVDDYGTTPEEEFRGEPLDGRLAREEPDVTADPGRPEDHATGDLDPDPHLDSQVSSYERIETGPASTHVGRLVEPDAGVPPDTEPAAIATDAGLAGGGPTAEEEAVRKE